MSPRAAKTIADAARGDAPLEEPEVHSIDDALWHLQVEALRVAQLAAEHGLNAAQRSDLRRALAVLRAAAEWQPAREAEPAL